jgi:hypothetical protein
MPPRQRLSLIVSCIIAIWCRLPAIPTVCAAMPGWRCHRAQSRQRFENEADPEAPTMKRGCIEMMSRPFLRGVSQIQLTKVAQIQLTKVAQIRVALTFLFLPGVESSSSTPLAGAGETRETVLPTCCGSHGEDSGRGGSSL